MAIPAQSYTRDVHAPHVRDVAVGVAADGSQMGAAAIAGRVSQRLVARLWRSPPHALAGAPLYAGALNLVAGAATSAIAAGAGNIVRRALGGGPPPPDAGAGAAASRAVLPGGLGVAEVRAAEAYPARAPVRREGGVAKRCCRS